MRGRIMPFFRPVTGPRQHHAGAAVHEHRADRHLAARRGRLRFGQRLGHVGIAVHVAHPAAPVKRGQYRIIASYGHLPVLDGS